MRRTFVVTAIALASVSCSSKPKGGLELSMQTDLLVPDDVSYVGLYLQQLEGSVVRNQWSYLSPSLYDAATQQYVVHFPATFGVQSRGVDADRVRVRVVAFRGPRENLVPNVVREARTMVPAADVATLRLPLLWINAGTASDAAPGQPVVPANPTDPSDAFTRYGSGCADEMTRDETGRCVPIDVAADSPLFGSVGVAGTCFDVTASFARGSGVATHALAELVSTDAGCAIPFEGNASAVNVGLVGSGPGYVTGSDGLTVRPLGSALLHAEAGRISFAQAVCDRMQDASFTGIAVSTRGAPWDGVTPTCSKWNVPDEALSVAPFVPDDQSDAGPDAEPDATADAGDAGPASWQLHESAVSGLAATAQDLYLTYADGRLERLPKEPGPPEAAVANVGVQRIYALGHHAQTNTDLVYTIDETDVLARVQRESLVLEPVDLCAGRAECKYVKATLPPVATADGRVFLVGREAPQAGPEVGNLYVSSASDPSAWTIVTPNLYPTYGSSHIPVPIALVGLASSVVYATIQDGEVSGKLCAPDCASGTLLTGPTGGGDPLRAFVPTPGAGDQFYAFVLRDSAPNQTVLYDYANATGTEVFVRSLALPTAAVRQGARICSLHPNGIQEVRCRSVAPPPTDDIIVNPGADASALTSDDTFVYWTEGGAQPVLRRLAWSTVAAP